MQATRCGIDLAGKLAPGMQRGQNDFQRGFVFVFRMRINRDATPVVADRTGPVLGQFQFDPAGVTGHGLIHGIIQDFGDQMVIGALVRAPDIHAGAAAHRL